MADEPYGILETSFLTAAALIAFAANSVLGRMALGFDAIDPGSYTAIRIASGAIMLTAIVLSRSGGWPARPDWRAVAALSCYMVFFSFAYRSLPAGTGTLLLFGAVQLTMFVYAIGRGERLAPLAWLGLSIAFAGLVYLVAPGLSAPDPLGAALMVVAGIAWGAYSLLGRRAAQPLLATTSNFVGSLPVALAIAGGTLLLGRVELSGRGVLLGVASGALSSAVGYSIWYAALRRLGAGQAATVQLSVPVLAAIGGILLLGEPLSARLVIASALTLGGIWLVLKRRAGTL